ncbi:peptidylprolyl isomerase [Acidovorax sp. LjRoot117]|uniref:peptidylprolyl isomerase n=1 Tax=Acidovorax sp. LjRoot117 TaxID=3342255 RepID=UPI003ED0F9C4
MNRFLCTPIQRLAAAALFTCATPGWAASPVLIEGASVAITAEDMQADSLRMPAEMRTVILQKPETVLQIASNLYARRAFAIRAEAEGLDKDPKVAAALKIARDKVLSDAMLEYQDKKNAPTDEALEGLARNVYRAKPDRFRTEEEVRVSHILFAGTVPESRKLAEQALQELKKGADFAVVAKERSADKASADKGGDLGFFAKGRMVPEFETAAAAMQKPGELSGIVETKFGYHIIKFNERKPSRIKTFEEAKSDLMKEIRLGLTQDARSAEAQKMQEGAKVNQEAVNAFAASYKPAQ